MSEQVFSSVALKHLCSEEHHRHGHFEAVHIEQLKIK